MKQRLPIYGIDCETCELLVDTKISKLSGVKVHSISKKGDYIDVEFDSLDDLENIKKVITDLGYNIEKSSLKFGFIYHITTLLLFIVFILAYFLFKDMPVFGGFDYTGRSGISLYFIIFIIGVVASLSTCMAVTGGVVVGLTRAGGLRANIGFQLGRIVGFTIGGAILGALGATITSLVGFNAILLLIAGIFMLYLGLNMLNLAPSIKLRYTKNTLASRVFTIDNPALAPLVGVLSFLLPCGFTQSMQVLRASSGSMWSGAMIMLVFALGTLPALFIVGLGSHKFEKINLQIINQAIGVLVVFFGVFMLYGFNNLLPTLSPNQENTNIVNIDGLDYEERFIFHNGLGLVGGKLELARGGNYKVMITPTVNGVGCNSEFIIPKLDNTPHPVLAGQSVEIDIIDAKLGEYKLICPTGGLSQGSIIIK